MKNTWKRFVAVIVLLIAVSPVGARAAVTVYAEDIPSGAVAPPVVTNPPATDGSVAGADHPPVRIDETGVHVGGANPVDINMPDIARGHGETATRALQNLAGMLAIIGTFGMPVAIIAIAGYFAYRRNKIAHETLRAMIEKGMPITPELVAEIRNKNRGNSAGGLTRSRLLPGLVLAGVGTALLIGGSRGEARGGWIVLFIGAAFLIVWFVEGKNQNSGQPPR
jgi:Domain of unknown function (DUF6249)